jgi:hypothetical protein
MLIKASLASLCQQPHSTATDYGPKCRFATTHQIVCICEMGARSGRDETDAIGTDLPTFVVAAILSALCGYSRRKVDGV